MVVRPDAATMSRHFARKRLAIEQELRIAAAAGEVTDEVQTIHFRSPENAKAQPAAYLGARPRLPFAPCGAQRLSIALNSCKTS